MASVEAVSLAGTSIFLEDCETIGSMMAKIAIAHQRMAMDIAIIDPASGERLKPHADIQHPKVNFIILDGKNVEEQETEVLRLNLRFHAEQNDLSTCAMVVRELEESNCLLQAEHELDRIVAHKRRNWEVATHTLLRLGVPESIALQFMIGCRCLDGVKAILSSQPPTDDQGANDERQERRNVFLAQAIESEADLTQIGKALLNADADANMRGNTSSTVLIDASKRGRVEMVIALLSARADINAPDTDGSPVLVAACQHSGCAAVVRVLLAAGSDVDACGANGRTALVEASARGFIEVVLVLLAAGANRDAKDRFDRTALTDGRF